MKRTKEDNMPDGTKIRIEDWSEDYSFMVPNSVVAAYPISKSTCGEWIRKGKSFRLELNFKTEEEAVAAHKSLVSGEKTMRDYLDNIEEKYHKCV